MKLPRELRRLVCQILAGVVLFAQLAVAAYACPDLSVAAMASAADAQAMPGCDQMDPDAAALCAEHCRFGQQSAETASPPAVPPAATPALLYLLPADTVLLLVAEGPAPAPGAAVRAAPPPPHAILHCVLRI